MYVSTHVVDVRSLAFTCVLSKIKVCLSSTRNFFYFVQLFLMSRDYFNNYNFIKKKTTELLF